jgi:hypothetical protein
MIIPMTQILSGISRRRLYQILPKSIKKYGKNEYKLIYVHK